MKGFLERAASVQKETTSHRRYLHENAEVGFELPKTMAYIEKVLRGYGYEPKRLGRCGIVAELAGQEAGDFILLRADVDGLNIQEESGLPFACRAGNMHACGHDLHAASLLSAAKLLKEIPPKKPIRFLFQAAEEILEGGEIAVREGVCDKVQSAFSLHVLSGVDLPIGQIVFPPQGVVAPSADTFEITLLGKSCHGGMPHDGVDATTAASAILDGLLSLSAREIPAGEGLLTVGILQSGDGANILSGKAQLCGSCRALDEDLRTFIKGRIGQIVKGISSAYRVKWKSVFLGGCPSLLIDEKARTRALKGFLQEFGVEKIVDFGVGAKRMGGAEDFAFISRSVPSLLVSISASKKGGLPLHHPRLVFDEGSLPTCVAAFMAFAHLS